METTETKNILVPVADSSEELETVAIVDVLRRTDARVVFASVDGPQVTGSKGVKLVTDCLLSQCLDRTYDLIVLPGGMPGAEHLRDAEGLTAMLQRQRDEGRLYAAICCAPVVVFHPHGLLKGRRFTCHPNFANLTGDQKPVDETVVVDGNLVTSRGAGTAVEFALKLVELLYGRQKRNEVAQGMVLP
ncbi:MAG: Chaperone protein YajL [Syntrophorhabdus sp. PtaU1.Bin058]|nr:MAG: Chaperone protein YajL [Syntrophorhabdus sp. PtaU1.Bin058]